MILFERYDTIQMRERKIKFERKKKYMATQIAPTPILTGKSAKKVLNQIKIKPSKETEKGMEILFKMFKDKEK